MGKVKVLTADDLLAQTEKRQVTHVDVERLGGRIYIREMSAEDIVVLNEGDGSATERGVNVVVRSLSDEDGNPLFTNKKQAAQFRSNVGVKSFLKIQEKVNEFNDMGAVSAVSLDDVSAALEAAEVDEDKAKAVMAAIGGSEEGND